MLCLTGPGGADRREVHGDSVALYLPFCDRMAEAYSASDLVVSRAGAGTLAELAACGTAAVLVPYPRAADDHQTANAAARVAAGAAVLLREQDIGALLDTVVALLENPAALAAMRAAQSREHALNRWDDLVDAVAPARHGEAPA